MDWPRGTVVPYKAEQQRPREILQRDRQPAETSDCSAWTQGGAQSTPDWQDLGLGNNRQIHKDPSWATQSNLAQHHQTGVKTIKTRPEAVQAHENRAAQPMSTTPVERTAGGKHRHVGTMQGDFPPTHCPVHVSAGSSVKSSPNGKSRLGWASAARRRRPGSWPLPCGGQAWLSQESTARLLNQLLVMFQPDDRWFDE